MNSPGRQVLNMQLEISGEKNSRKNEETEPKQKQYPAVDVTGDGCCEEQYCRGTWNVRSMNQGKLEVVKLEMTRVNIDILGVSQPRWTEMCEFNSDDHYTYYCGQESLRRNGVAIMVNKRDHCNEKPQHCNEEQLLLATTRESSSSEDQQNQKERNKKKPK